MRPRLSVAVFPQKFPHSVHCQISLGIARAEAAWLQPGRGQEQSREQFETLRLDSSPRDNSPEAPEADVTVVAAVVVVSIEADRGTGE